MNENLMEIREFTGPGYSPVVDFGTWRVAILNYIDEIHPAQIDYLERHNETDEVFVLVQGQAILFIGEGDAALLSIQAQALEQGKIYNVKKSIWHSVVLSRDGSVLIVENQDTSRENSDYIQLEPDHRHQIQEMADRFMPGQWR